MNSHDQLIVTVNEKEIIIESIPDEDAKVKIKDEFEVVKSRPKMRPWVIKDLFNTIKCKYCPKAVMTSKESSLIDHENSEKHILNLSINKEVRCRGCYKQIMTFDSKKVTNKVTGSKIDYMTALLQIAGVEVDSRDVLCADCCEDVQSSYAFRMQVRSTNIRYFKKPNVKPPVINKEKRPFTITIGGTVKRERKSEVENFDSDFGGGFEDDGDFEPVKSNPETATPIKNENQAFQCLECSETFEDNLSLLQHFRSSHGSNIQSKRQPKPKTNKNPDRSPEETFRCGVCGKLYSNVEELDQHCRQHGDTEVIMCGLCERFYTKFICFKRHFKTHHPEHTIINDSPDTENIFEIEDSTVAERILQDVRMTTITDVISSYIAPMEEQVEIEAYVQVCGICGEVILSVEQLKTHNQTEHKDFATRCYICAKSFLTSINRNAHLAKCKQIESLKQCLICEERLPTDERLLSHCKLRHGEADYKRILQNFKRKPKYICQYCGVSFVSKDSFRNHRFCGPLEECSCDICHKTFDRKGKLIRHMRLHTCKPKVHLCQYCGSGYKGGAQLRAHIRSRHTGEQPYACAECGRCFTHQQTYRNHILMHKNIFNFKCDICEKKFRRNSVLRNHRMTHTGEKPFQCKVCHVAFIQAYSLKRHMEKHTKYEEQSLQLDPNPYPRTEGTKKEMTKKREYESDESTSEDEADRKTRYRRHR